MSSSRKNLNEDFKSFILISFRAVVNMNDEKNEKSILK